MSILWLAIMIAFLVIEGMTAQFVSIWFAVGCIIPLIMSIFNIEFTFQLLTFAAVSLILILSTRTFVKKLTKPHHTTNTDSLIGKVAIVCEEINNIEESGIIKMNGVEWSVRSEDDEVISKGEKVIITRISGVRLIVKKVSHKETINK